MCFTSESEAPDPLARSKLPLPCSRRQLAEFEREGARATEARWGAEQTWGPALWHWTARTAVKPIPTNA